MTALFGADMAISGLCASTDCGEEACPALEAEANGCSSNSVNDPEEAPPVLAPDAATGSIINMMSRKLIEAR
jgi:hypothetical protein